MDAGPQTSGRPSTGFAGCVVCRLGWSALEKTAATPAFSAIDLSVPLRTLNSVIHHQIHPFQGQYSGARGVPVSRIPLMRLSMNEFEQLWCERVEGVQAPG
jgi:hypothetical protein